MLDDQNPYAPPVQKRSKRRRRAKEWDPEAGAPVAGTMWREGQAAIMHQAGGRLPDRCVRCNEPVTKWLTKKLFWHPPAVYLALLIGALPYIILASVLRRSTTIDFGLCDAHASQRLLGILIGWGGFLGSLVMLFIGGAQDIDTLVFLGLALLLGAPITGAVMARMITVKKIDEEHAWFSVGRPFLDSLPRND